MAETQVTNSDAQLGAMPEIPETLPGADMLRMARDGEPFTILKVGVMPTKEWGDMWQYIIRRQDGKQYDFTLWPNAKRDDLANWLMAHESLEGIPPLRLRNGGSDTKPFYYVDKA